MGNIISVRFVERYCACRENIPTFTHWMFEYAQHKPVCYRDSGDRVLSVALPGTSEAQAGMKKGMLMSIGKPVGKNGVSPCYIFPEEDSQAEVLQLSDWEILSYREDFKMRRKYAQSLL